MEKWQVLTVKMTVSVVLGGVVWFLLYLYTTLIWKPKRLQSRLEKQGIRGPSPSFLVGNVPDIKRIQTQKAQSAATRKQDDTIPHDWYSTVFSYIEQWRKQYGNPSSLFFLVLSFYLLELSYDLGLGFWSTSTFFFFFFLLLFILYYIIVIFYS